MFGYNYWRTIDDFLIELRISRIFVYVEFRRYRMDFLFPGWDQDVYCFEISFDIEKEELKELGLCFVVRAKRFKYHIFSTIQTGM